MSPQDTFQSISTFDLKLVYISLGLPKSSFGGSGSEPSRGPFDTALDGGTQYPDSVWFFRGENCYRFSKQGIYEDGPKRLADVWGGANWPLAFASGIDAAVWGGPSYPNIVYFYKDNLYIRYNVASAQVDVAPSSIWNDWGSSRGNWLADGPGAALHAIETKYPGRIHFFKKAEYLRHDLNTGNGDVGPIPLTQQYPLPDPFAQGIDLAFYGSGDESQKVYFFKGDQYLLYDLKENQVQNVAAIEERFSAMAQYITRPQLFLVEHYQLNTFVGPSEAGELVETLSIPGRTKQSVILVTEVTETSSATIQQTLLQSQDDTTQNDFYNQMKSQNEQSGSKEGYDYHLDASFHGDASATGLTGGEVNANLKAQGGSNDVRISFANAVDGTIQSQLNTTTKQVKQQVYSSDQQYTRTEQTVRMEEQTIDNTNSDQLLVYEYHQQRQTYLSLLILRGERLAFADGQNPPAIVDISQMDNFLSKYILQQQDRDDIRQLILGELTTINDYQGTPTSVLKEVNLPSSSGGQQTITVYQFNPALKTSYSMTNPDGSQQVIMVDGLVMADHSWKVPTYTMIPIQKS